jgi:hypothetical protein
VRMSADGLGDDRAQHEGSHEPILA